MSKREEAAYLICAVTAFVIMAAGWIVTGTPVPWWESLLMFEIPIYFLFRWVGFVKDLDAGAGFEPATYGL
jgi:hypothetical protein